MSFINLIVSTYYKQKQVKIRIKLFRDLIATLKTIFGGLSGKDMRKQQESEGFKLTSENELSPLDSSRQSLTQKTFDTPEQTQPLPITLINKTKHVYLEQQNTYGRFIPYLLLKDQIKSELDSSGHTALHHMCSHNSEYLPLYISTLKMHDPCLNTPSKVGHAPLDIAGIYSRKQYVDLLVSKGAIDNGNIDHWAIQGGNIQNWTGHVDVNKKHLIHWAAYNDMPEVLKEFYKQGANLSQKDGNDFTPIDLAVINKSYKSIKVLAQLGFKPKDDIVKQSQSKSIQKILKSFNETEKSKCTKQTAKSLFVPFYCILSWLLVYFTTQLKGFSLCYVPNVVTLSLLVALRYFIKVENQPRYANTRYSVFYSDIIGCEVNDKSNHLIYFLLCLSMALTGLVALVQSQTYSYLGAIFYFVEFYIFMVYVINCMMIAYGIVRNLTHQEMFDSDKCKYLWRQVHYVAQKKMLTRKMNNPLDRGITNNIKQYVSRNLA